MFSLLAVLVFMGSTLNLGAISKLDFHYEDSRFCQNVALDAVDSWEETHGCLSARESNDMYNRWYAACEIFNFSDQP